MKKLLLKINTKIDWFINYIDLTKKSLFYIMLGSYCGISHNIIISKSILKDVGISDYRYWLSLLIVLIIIGVPIHYIYTKAKKD